MNSGVINGLVITMVGFGPAMVMFFLMFRNYERYFEYKNLMMSFGVGIVFGSIIAVFHGFVDPMVLPFIDLSILIFVIAFAIFEELFKFIALNFPRLQGKYEIAYYGAALGFGIGSMRVVTITFMILSESGDELLNPTIIAVLLALSFCFSLLHGSLGCLIGYGCARQEGSRYLSRAILAHVIFNVLFVPFMWVTLFPIQRYPFLALALIYAFFLFWYIYRNIMPETLPTKMKKVKESKERMTKSKKRVMYRKRMREAKKRSIKKKK